MAMPKPDPQAYQSPTVPKAWPCNAMPKPDRACRRWEKENHLKAEICEYILPKSLEYIWLRWKQATGDSVLCRIQRKDDQIWGISLQAARAIAIAGIPFLSKVVLNKEEWRTLYDVEGSERNFK
uniref:Uncharacterized protein n=1 Tax=Chromera velia CCMP2878 TaxID=1169474 RepID=A0A0G4GPQ9_9ALVE|eukprot:Cvel_22835.t1-p1 / transcript=Cvel_22835.t1 / gene=Cvel_22835 / organism=Chromera_velia_CCMP2878 / gene_product=hypothetical protein / transcript_product=hypothetical protein / location=Cvel_scaffold2287:10408-11794(-) / protein_length=123 / sequence_SO=supercontig / SO=protein_coding / is_pseudo=false